MQLYTVYTDGAFLGSPLCTLVIPKTLFLRLYEEKRGLLEGVSSSITGGVLSLDPTCSKIQNALRKAASRLYSRKRSCKGSRDRTKLRDGKAYVLVEEGEILTVRGLAGENLEEVSEKTGGCLCIIIRWDRDRRGGKWPS